MVLSELSLLHLKINAIGENVSSIVAFHKSNAGSLLPTSSLDAITSLNKRLPIKSVEELTEFESWLGDEKNYKLMVKSKSKTFLTVRDTNFIFRLRNSKG